jgi:hypothetical protein
MRVVRNDQEAGRSEAPCVPPRLRGYFGMVHVARSVPVITKDRACGRMAWLGALPQVSPFPARHGEAFRAASACDAFGQSAWRVMVA